MGPWVDPQDAESEDAQSDHSSDRHSHHSSDGQSDLQSDPTDRLERRYDDLSSGESHEKQEEGRQQRQVGGSETHLHADSEPEDDPEYEPERHSDSDADADAEGVDQSASVSHDEEESSTDFESGESSDSNDEQIYWDTIRMFLTPALYSAPYLQSLCGVANLVKKPGETLLKPADLKKAVQFSSHVFLPRRKD